MYRALAGALVLVALSPARGQDPEAVSVTGKAVPSLASFDRLMQDFARENAVPGTAVAITKDGRLVYVRGFGWADREAQVPVGPTSLFRIASVSKPITAVAVMQLVERGKLRLDDRPFALLGAKPLASDAKLDPRLESVTVLHLLQHRGGWDRAKSFDPMFRSLVIARAFNARLPVRPDHIIRYMTTQPLDFDPGHGFAYSNFGYCVLGRLIERASGKSYEEYVREEVLKPLGIVRMRLGKTLRHERAEGEVTYYPTGEKDGPAVVGSELGEPVPVPYGAWNLEAMDANGGWIASAIDLARFAVAFDNAEKCPILNEQSIRTMWARPEGETNKAWYACGWNVRSAGDGKVSTWHNGALDGTSTLLVRRADGVNFVVLCNARSGPKAPFLTGAVEGKLNRLLDAMKEWPGLNQFEVE